MLVIVKTLVITLTSSLAALVSAAPTLGAFKHDSAHNGTNVHATSSGLPHMLFHDCSNEIYMNRSSGGSPLVEDCKYIADVMIPDFDHTPICWSWHDTVAREILSHGTCAVNIASRYPREPAGNLVEMCNKDIQDFIHYAIDNFRWTTPEGHDVVGAEAYASCPSDFPAYRCSAVYGLYHT
ncbi:putative necrosis-inducing factor-domain-containing protein [Sordaria brevicollis]|uniref:Necrosis-inducing factor-domain-containing protein n=1 Tax=Sordaria brevicollis TaxID=83679 RepID=A0AAE0U2I1_SORBR|nr:putative necrosis-inducing factor-domain-containing protein [Sordaria brevicollis]